MNECLPNTVLTFFRQQADRDYQQLDASDALQRTPMGPAPDCGSRNRPLSSNGPTKRYAPIVKRCKRPAVLVSKSCIRAWMSLARSQGRKTASVSVCRLSEQNTLEDRAPSICRLQSHCVCVASLQMPRSAQLRRSRSRERGGHSEVVVDSNHWTCSPQFCELH